MFDDLSLPVENDLKNIAFFNIVHNQMASHCTASATDLPLRPLGARNFESASEFYPLMPLPGQR
jgi:hypothetical protein